MTILPRACSRSGRRWEGGDLAGYGEPTASVDSATALTIHRALAEVADSGVGVLVVSHHEADLVNWADRVLRLG